MGVDLFRFITPYAAPPDPNSAANAAMGAFAHRGSLQRQDSAQKEQAREFDIGEQRRVAEQNWQHQTDVMNAVTNFTKMIAEDPDNATQYENQLRALGVDFAPSTTASPDTKDMTAPGQPAQQEQDDTTSRLQTEIHNEADAELRAWYEPIAKKLGLDPDPFNPEHHYDYRGAYAGFQRGEYAPPDQPGGHWPSEYKLPGHPREFMQDAQGRRVDTKSGTYVDDGSQAPQDVLDGLTEFPGRDEGLDTQNPVYRRDLSEGISTQNPTYDRDLSKGLDTKNLTAPLGTSPLAHMSRSPQTADSVTAPVENRAAADAALKMNGVTPPLAKFRASWKGIDLGEFDPESFRRTKKAEAERFAAGIVAGTNETDRPLVEQQFSGARSPKDVEDITKSFTIPQMAITHGDYRQELKSKRGGKGGAVQSGLSDKQAATLNNEIRSWVQLHGNFGGVRALNDAATGAARALALISSPDALANKVAVAQQIKNLFGAAASEGERAFVLGAKGIADRLMIEVDNWVNGGELPADFKSSVNDLTNLLNEGARKRMDEISTGAEEGILGNPLVGGRLPESTKPGVRRAIRAAITSEAGSPAAPSAPPPGQRSGRPDFLAP